MSVMVKDWMATGLKLRMRGYKSMGLSVPDVMTTVWNLANTGLTARLASKQLNCSTASVTLGRYLQARPHPASCRLRALMQE